ncbi:hypothetical protein BHM03_00000745 [Ensete ventricosum]|uniref:Uncharacterized protein n=1 Tax=Ensete ventricosum TaxID=4639 RepID=A0A427B9J3_ENSVE|nr:hypothetical protein B296_00004619 [Ensete ventricosum]RZR76122.1 hypothetical protein BHM03_00000745 [Ensete ventricosum]
MKGNIAQSWVNFGYQVPGSVPLAGHLYSNNSSQVMKFNRLEKCFSQRYKDFDLFLFFCVIADGKRYIPSSIWELWSCCSIWVCIPPGKLFNLNVVMILKLISREVERLTSHSFNNKMPLSQLCGDSHMGPCVLLHALGSSASADGLAAAGGYDFSSLTQGTSSHATSSPSTTNSRSLSEYDFSSLTQGMFSKR